MCFFSILPFSTTNGADNLPGVTQDEASPNSIFHTESSSTTAEARPSPFGVRLKPTRSISSGSENGPQSPNTPEPRLESTNLFKAVEKFQGPLVGKKEVSERQGGGNSRSSSRKSTSSGGKSTWYMDSDEQQKDVNGHVVDASLNKTNGSMSEDGGKTKVPLVENSSVSDAKQNSAFNVSSNVQCSLETSSVNSIESMPNAVTQRSVAEVKCLDEPVLSSTASTKTGPEIIKAKMQPRSTPEKGSTQVIIRTRPNFKPPPPPVQGHSKAQTVDEPKANDIELDVTSKPDEQKNSVEVSSSPVQMRRSNRIINCVDTTSEAEDKLSNSMQQTTVTDTSYDDVDMSQVVMRRSNTASYRSVCKNVSNSRVPSSSSDEGDGDDVFDESACNKIFAASDRELESTELSLDLNLDAYKRLKLYFEDKKDEYFNLNTHVVTVTDPVLELRKLLSDLK